MGGYLYLFSKGTECFTNHEMYSESQRSFRPIMGIMTKSLQELIFHLNISWYFFMMPKFSHQWYIKNLRPEVEYVIALLFSIYLLCSLQQINISKPPIILSLFHLAFTPTVSVSLKFSISASDLFFFLSLEKGRTFNYAWTQGHRKGT